MLYTFTYIIILPGELALCGCTVRVYDHNTLNLQTVHSRISEQIQELTANGLLPPQYNLKVCSYGDIAHIMHV